MSRVGMCENCGMRTEVRAVVVGPIDDGTEGTRCEHCAGDAWTWGYFGEDEAAGEDAES